MTKQSRIKKTLFGVIFLYSTIMYGHFGMVIPSTSMLGNTGIRKIIFELSFSHPREGVGMKLEKPAEFAVFHKGKKKSLLSSLIESKVMGKKGWTSKYEINKPGVYSFYMRPQPYWEPAEDCFIVHYTKTVLGAFGSQADWDAELGLKTEIVPLTRPFGLYAGNSFRGIVKLDGKPVPFAEVEIEFYDQKLNRKPENSYMTTQSVKADSLGVFSYTPPAPGWWGFSALNKSKEKLKYRGTEKDVELGAVLWVEFIKWTSK